MDRNLRLLLVALLCTVVGAGTGYLLLALTGSHDMIAKMLPSMLIMALFIPAQPDTQAQ